MDTPSNSALSTTDRARHAPQVSPHRYLTVRHRRHGIDMEIYTPVGAVDLYTVSLLRDELRDAERRHSPRVLVDLSETTFLAVAGVRVLVTAAEQARAAHRQLVLAGATRSATRALAIAAEGSGLVSYGGLSEAVEAFSVPRQPVAAAD